MKKYPNNFRSIRRKTHLSQKEVAFILNVPSTSSICRYESGMSQPPLEAVMGYVLLFDGRFIDLFPQQAEDMRIAIKERLIELKARIVNQDSTNADAYRLDQIDTIITRLSTKAYEA